MSEVLSRALRGVSRVPGVRAALVVDAQAGIPVVAETVEGVAAPAVAALSASLVQWASRATETVALGPVDVLQLETEGGLLLVVSAGEMVVAALVDDDAQLGMARLALQQVAEALR